MNKNRKINLILIIVLAFSSLGYVVYEFSNSKQEQESKTNEIQNIPQESLKSNYQNTYTIDQVALKNKSDACWTIINGNIYDITSYIPNHPGGIEEIIKICGKDGSKLFSKPMEHKEGGADNILNNFKIGILQQ
jgi:cytochrome b involved in lipid metabolism